MLGLKLNHVSKRGPRSHYIDLVYLEYDGHSTSRVNSKHYGNNFIDKNFKNLT